jgi:hypothetical protein
VREKSVDEKLKLARTSGCDWLGASADAAERLGLYGRVLDQLVAAIHRLMGDRLEEKPLWAARGSDLGEVQETLVAPKSL